MHIIVFKPLSLHKQQERRNLNDAQRIDLVDKLFGLKEKQEAKERIDKKLTDRDQGGKFTTQVDKGKVRDKLGIKAKVSGRQYEKGINLVDVILLMVGSWSYVLGIKRYSRKKVIKRKRLHFLRKDIKVFNLMMCQIMTEQRNIQLVRSWLRISDGLQVNLSQKSDKGSFSQELTLCQKSDKGSIETNSKRTTKIIKRKRFAEICKP